MPARKDLEDAPDDVVEPVEAETPQAAAAPVDLDPALAQAQIPGQVSAVSANEAKVAAAAPGYDDPAPTEPHKGDVVPEDGATRIGTEHGQYVVKDGHVVGPASS